MLPNLSFADQGLEISCLNLKSALYGKKYKPLNFKLEATSFHYFDDKKGHVLVKNQPLAICDKTANALNNLKRNDIFISESTFHYDGGGCC